MILSMILDASTIHVRCTKITFDYTFAITLLSVGSELGGSGYP